MGFEQVFDNRTIKRMDTLSTGIQPLVDHALNYCLSIHAILSKF